MYFYGRITQPMSLNVSVRILEKLQKMFVVLKIAGTAARTRKLIIHFEIADNLAKRCTLDDVSLFLSPLFTKIFPKYIQKIFLIIINFFIINYAPRYSNNKKCISIFSGVYLFCGNVCRFSTFDIFVRSHSRICHVPQSWWQTRWMRLVDSNEKYKHIYTYI